MVIEGKKAPIFSLLDSNGVKVSLSDYKGWKVVLYFYPRDMTTNCTKEACDFRDQFPDFKKVKTVVLGVSPDSVLSHKKFADKYDLPFILLSDEKKVVVQKFGVWKEKNMYGRKYMGVERTTFVLDEKGKIRKIFPRVKVNGHVKEIVKVLKEI